MAYSWKLHHKIRLYIKLLKLRNVNVLRHRFCVLGVVFFNGEVKVCIKCLFLRVSLRYYAIYA
jgi:hypothetical protein